MEISIAASVSTLIAARNSVKCSGSMEGASVSGWRACRCSTAAPARGASIACAAMSSGRQGRAGDMVGVWIAPVIAQDTMTG